MENDAELGAYVAHETPTLYPQPPPNGEQPPPSACLAFIQAWKNQLTHRPHSERSLRERLGLPDAAEAQIPCNKQPHDPTDVFPPCATATKQRRFTIGGLLNPDTENQGGATGSADSEIAKIMAQSDEGDSILTLKETPLPQIFPGN